MTCTLLAFLLVTMAPAPAVAQDTGAVDRRSLPEWLTLSGSFRVRPEARWGRRFEPGNDEGYTLTRLRVAAGLRAGDWVRFHVEAQDARAPGLDGAGTTLRDPLDLYQGYVELGALDGPMRLRVGRQEMPYGAGRLLSRNPWRNIGRSFDAARLLLGTDRVGVDVFAASIIDKDQEGFDEWQEGETLYGLYGRIQDEENRLRVEPYLLMRNRSVTATRPITEDRYSLGVRAVHRLTSAVETRGEVVRQLGEAGDALIGAWMAHGVIGYDLLDVDWRPRLRVEYAHASGDDPGDPRLQGFDTLYRTPHRYHGYADLIGGRNLRDAQLGVGLSPWRDLSVSADLHRFWLVDRRDGLYGPGLGLVVPAPSGGAESTDVGVELDLTVTYPLTPRLTVGGGWSRLFPGRFLERNASDTPSSFLYGLVEVRL